MFTVYCHCGAGLAVTGRVRDIGHSVFQSAFETGSSNSPQLLPDFLPYRIPVGGPCYKYNNYIIINLK